MPKQKKAINWLVLLLFSLLSVLSIWSGGILLHNTSQQSKTSFQNKSELLSSDTITPYSQEDTNNSLASGITSTPQNSNLLGLGNENLVFGIAIFLFIICVVILWTWSLRRSIKKKTSELRVSEKKYRDLINSATEGIVIIIDQAVEYLNPQVKLMFNFSDELPKTTINFLDHIHPLDKELIVIKYQQLMEESAINLRLSFRILTADGLTKWVRSNTVKIDWEGKTALLAFVSEITEERKLEDSIKSSEERYRLIFDQTPVGMFYYNTDLHITNVNDRFNEIMHSNDNEALNFDLNTIDNSTIIDALKVVNTHEKGYYEGSIKPFMSIHLPDLHVKLRTSPMFNEKHEFQGGIGLLEDITEQILSEHKIQNLEEKFEKVIFTSTDAINIIKIPDGVFMDINRGFTELTGYTREEIIGKSALDIDLWVNVEDREKLMKGVLEFGEYKNLESLFRSKDGSVHHGLMSASFIEIEGNPCLLTVTRDIDEIKKTNEIIKKSELRYQSIFESVPVAIWEEDFSTVFDMLENLRKLGVQDLAEYMADHPEFVETALNSIIVLDVNDVCLKFYKAESKEQLKMSLDKLFDSESLQNFKQELLAIWNHETLFNGDTINQNLEGERIPINIVMRIPSTREEFQHILVSITDITQRKMAEDALRESEKRYRTIFNSVPVSIKEEDYSKVVQMIEEVKQAGIDDFEKFLDFNPEWVKKAAKNIRITEVNQESLRIFRADSKVQLLQTLDQYFSEESYSSFKKVLLSLWNHENVHEQETINKTITGENINVWVSFEFPTGQIDYSRILVTSMDITERKRAEEQIRLQIRYLAALRAVDMAISASMDLPITLRVLLNQIHQQLIADAASILILDQHTQTLRYAAGIGFQTNAIEYTSLRLGQGYAGQAALERRIITITDLALKSSHNRTRDLEKEEFTHYIGIPLISKGTVKGVLELFNHGPFTQDSSWMGLLESMAGQAAIAIENSTLMEEVQKVNLNLRSAYDATIEGWARSIDIGSGDLENHSKRAADLTIELAQVTGFEGEGLLDLRRGALLHDIGKLSIPDAILKKPGSLTDEEWIIMKNHPIAARDLLNTVDFLHSAMDIPLNHHEHWDGSGYPHGLTGTNIPFGARLFAIVDCWVALRSDRPWRKAWTDDNAWNYIESNSGKLFDPHIVEKFRQMLGHGFAAYY